MSEVYSIRFSKEEKAALQGKSKKLGFSSAASFAKYLIKQGLESFELKKVDEHVFCNSAQSVILLREILGLMSGNDAHTWTDRFKKSIGE